MIGVTGFVNINFRAFMELLRPPLAPMDLAMPGAAALLASFAWTGGFPPLLPFILATLGAYCAITSSYVYNDCCDIDVDRVAMPNRPLPSAEVTKGAAMAYALFLFIVAALIALYLNPESFVVLCAATIIISVYSMWAKRNTPFSWVLVGLSFGLVPIGVWLAISPMGILKAGPGIHAGALMLGLMICITDWGFTNCDASRDTEGDRMKGIPTLPATYGIPATSRFVALCWFVGVILSLALGLATGLGPLYLGAALIAGVWILVQNMDFVRNPTSQRGDRLFYQAANYRAVLFLFLIIDVLLRATISYPGITL